MSMKINVYNQVYAGFTELTLDMQFKKHIRSLVKKPYIFLVLTWDIQIPGQRTELNSLSKDIDSHFDMDDSGFG